MDIPRDFSQLTQEQLMRFAKAGFDTYWELVDRLKASKEINSTMQHISQDVEELQKIINKQNKNYMERFSIYCTEEQTKKTLELGAPIKIIERCSKLANSIIISETEDCYTLAIIPTAEQMIGWLEERIDSIEVIKETNGSWLYLFYPTNSSKHEIESKYPSRKEATLAAIDAALEYLSNKK